MCVGAISGYVHGRRATPVISADEPASCPQTCVHGICELGTCKCWKGALSSEPSVMVAQVDNVHLVAPCALIRQVVLTAPSLRAQNAIGVGSLGCPFPA